MNERRWVLWSAVFGFWMLFGVISTIDLYFVHQQEHPLAQTFFWAMPDMLIWAAFTPLVAFFTVRLPLDNRQWTRSLPIHFVIGLTIPFVHHLADISFNAVVYTMAGLEYSFLTGYSGIRYEYFELFATYWVVVGFVYFFLYYGRFREKELRAKSLESQLAHAQLQALKMQLNPHFLFNTLNAVSALVEEDPQRAKRVISRLGDLLRTSLESSGVQEISLQNEIDTLQKYLDIEQVRLGDRLKVEMSIDPQTRDAVVPNLILQPIVENAVHHGVAKRTGQGIVSISALKENGNLQLSVQDNGNEIDSPSKAETEGVGISNTRERLNRLYGSDAHFNLAQNNGMTEAKIIIPFKLKHDELTSSDE